MIVCVCHAVSDGHMRQLVAGGASEHEIVRLTRAGTSCGCCVDAVKALMGAPRPACGKDVPCPGCECLEADVGARAA
jgi:bacterioferritin-associated ferredoxin